MRGPGIVPESDWLCCHPIVYQVMVRRDHMLDLHLFCSVLPSKMNHYHFDMTQYDQDRSEMADSMTRPFRSFPCTRSAHDSKRGSMLCQHLGRCPYIGPMLLMYCGAGQLKLSHFTRTVHLLDCPLRILCMQLKGLWPLLSDITSLAANKKPQKFRRPLLSHTPSRRHFQYIHVSVDGTFFKRLLFMTSYNTSYLGLRPVPSK